AIEYRVDFGGVLEQERQAVQGKALLDAGEQTRGDQGHVDGATLNRGNHLRVTAQGAAGEDHHLHLAVALLLDQVGELLRAQTGGVILGLKKGDLEVGSVGFFWLRVAGGQQQRRGTQQ